MRHLRTTRLGGKLDGEHVLALRVADEVDDDHLRRDFLLLGNQVDGKLVLTKGCLDSGQVELVDGGTSVSAEADAEGVEVLLVRGVDQSSPSLLGCQLGDTSPVDDTTLGAFEGPMTWLVAKPALLGISGAATSSMAFFAASVAGTGKRALDTRVGAVSLVVTDFTAVEALSGQAAAFGLIRAVASEMACLSATVKTVSVRVKVRVGWLRDLRSARDS